MAKLITLALLVLLPASALAQNPRTAKVAVTVVDPTGGVIAGATVTLVGLETATKTAPPPSKTSDKGVATFDSLAPGRYSIQAEFTGFDLGLVRDIRIAPGDNKRVVVLPLLGVSESVTVGAGQEGASTRKTTAAFGLSLSEEQVGALSDDPNELMRQITELGGPEAIIRVDSFEGQQLPPKSQIKSIHVTRDQFAAEAEFPGNTFVDIITQAGSGPIRGGVNMSLRDGSLDGQNPFLKSGVGTPGQFKNYGFNLGGTLVKDRADFSLSVNGNDVYRLPILNAGKVAGATSQVLNRRETTDARTVNGLINYALTRDQTLRLGFTSQTRTFDGGVGGYDSLDRAYTTDGSQNGLRVMEAGPIGRRMFLNTRISGTWTDSTRRSIVEAPTIVVLDSTTTGGAQVAGGTHSRQFSIESDLDYVRGIHSWRAGVKITGATFRTDERNNYLGTYTFSSADDYLAGKPALFTIETGNPAFSYFNAQSAVYLQDDIRVNKGLTLSPGVRYSRQTWVDSGAFGPRFGITWAPFKSGRTTVRASAGAYSTWLGGFGGNSTVAQALRLDGTHQRQIIVDHPSYPVTDLDSVAVVPPTKYLIGDDYGLGNNVRFSAGIDQTISPRLRVSLLYAYWHLTNLARGQNLNPLVNGVRFDPAFGNVVATVSDAEIRRYDVYATFAFSLAPPGPAANAARVNLRRLTISGFFTRGHPWRNGAGDFDVPPSGTLDTEWGPGPFSQRYFVSAAISSAQIRNLAINVGLNMFDGYPYQETTGRDDNGDGFLNDRPAGVGLWALRAAGQKTVNVRVAYTFARRTVPASMPARYRTMFFVDIQNLTNHANYVGYSGVISSQNFMQPTAVANPRTINMGLGVNF